MGRDAVAVALLLLCLLVAWRALVAVMVAAYTWALVAVQP